MPAPDANSNSDASRTADNQPESLAAENRPVQRTLGRIPRRVLGVLVEKAKTTPDNYPLSIAAIIAGANQKSNRSPQMTVDEDDVVEALDNLRAAGAAIEVQGVGRVNKYRHAAYEWLGVTAHQAAVMTELLLRGPQTAGELRTRAGRMETFSDLNAVLATLGELQEKGLVAALTPPGRGQQFRHTLYESQELAKLAATVPGVDEAALTWATSATSGAATAAHQGTSPVSSRPATEVPPTGLPRTGPAVAELADELAELRKIVTNLTARVDHLERELGVSPES
ncbi:DUF480 domain-containing protein [Planctomycetaceae bacterium SH139]